MTYDMCIHPWSHHHNQEWTHQSLPNTSALLGPHAPLSRQPLIASCRNKSVCISRILYKLNHTERTLFSFWLPFSIITLSSSMVWCVSILHSFLLLTGVLWHGYAKLCSSILLLITFGFFFQLLTITNKAAMYNHGQVYVSICFNLSSVKF